MPLYGKMMYLPSALLLLLLLLGNLNTLLTAAKVAETREPEPSSSWSKSYCVFFLWVVPTSAKGFILITSYVGSQLSSNWNWTHLTRAFAYHIKSRLFALCLCVSACVCTFACIAKRASEILLIELNRNFIKSKGHGLCEFISQFIIKSAKCFSFGLESVWGEVNTSYWYNDYRFVIDKYFRERYGVIFALYYQYIYQFICIYWLINLNVLIDRENSCAIYVL